jgi:similar to stage IV sporulation protein
MLIKILRYFKGYVTFLARGKFSERLINILNARGVHYWNVIPNKDGGLYVNMYITDYKNLHNYIRKTGINCKIICRKGFPFFIKKYKYRIGLPIGVTLFVGIIWLLSGFIWNIAITGNETLATSEILEVANEIGLYQGAYVKSINVKSMERKILQELPDIRWISINISGCKAEISIKEKYKSPKVVKSSEPCNIISAKDGIIVKTSGTKGTTIAKKGSAVVKGQLLISGVVTGETGESTLVHSSGEVLAETKYNKTYKLPKQNNFQTETENYIVRNRLNFFWFSMPVDFKEINYSCYKSLTKKVCLNINGVDLPISLTKQYVTEMVNKKLIQKAEKKSLLKLAVLNEVFNFKDKEITGKDYKYTQDKNYYYLKVNYNVVEDVAVTSKIYLR